MQQLTDAVGKFPSVAMHPIKRNAKLKKTSADHCDLVNLTKKDMVHVPRI